MPKEKKRKGINKMWKRYNIVLKLKSPFHIGYTPFRSSVVSPTRYYVLGKNFWEHLPKELQNIYLITPILNITTI